MRRSHPGGLPRLRPSFPGTPVKHSQSPGPGLRVSAWVVLLLLATALLACYLHMAGSIGRLQQQLSSSGGGSGGGSSRRRSSSQAAADLDAQQQMLQGIDFAEQQAAAPQQQQQQQQQQQHSLNGTSHASDSSSASSGSSGSGSSSGSVAAASAGAGFLDVHRGVRDVPDALRRVSRLHGLVAKQGMTDPRAWLANNSDARLDQFLSWRFARLHAGGPRPLDADSYTCAAADHPPQPFPGCHVFVNHEYRYIYIRTPKAASTSIVNVLGECDNVATAGHNSSSCMVLHFYWPKRELAPDALQATWRDYFVFGFVRNPWRRAYSLFKYLHSNGCMTEAALKDPSCRVTWPAFCADPWAAAEALHERGCIKRSRSYLYFHMQDQLRCFLTANGSWAVDFIGRVDESREDWAQVVRTLNANRLPGVPELPLAPLEQKNVRAGNARDPYSVPAAADARCFDSVSRWYACDIEAFGFASQHG